MLNGVILGVNAIIGTLLSAVLSLGGGTASYLGVQPQEFPAPIPALEIAEMAVNELDESVNSIGSVTLGQNNAIAPIIICDNSNGILTVGENRAGAPFEVQYCEVDFSLENAVELPMFLVTDDE